MVRPVRIDPRPLPKASSIQLLIGQPTLRRRLKLAVMAALDQRFGTRLTIGGMSLEDTTDYLKGHLGFAGRADPSFSGSPDVSVVQENQNYLVSGSGIPLSDELKTMQKRPDWIQYRSTDSPFACSLKLTGHALRERKYGNSSAEHRSSWVTYRTSGPESH